MLPLNVTYVQRQRCVMPRIPPRIQNPSPDTVGTAMSENFTGVDQ